MMKWVSQTSNCALKQFFVFHEMFQTKSNLDRYAKMMMLFFFVKLYGTACKNKKKKKRHNIFH